MWHGLTLDAHQAPTLITVHGPIHPPPGHAVPAVQRLLRHADWINTVSQAGLDDVLQQVPEYRDRSGIVPLGIPASVVPVSPYPSPPLVAWCGRIVEGKGIDVAIAAFQIVAARAPDVRFLVVGQGPERAGQEREVARLGLTDRVTFAGVVPSVPQVLNEASLLVMSSRTEGFGYVVLEAALQARPTVAPRIEGLVEAIADGESGLLVELTPAALAQGVLSLLGAPGRLRAMGEAARARALRDFSVDRMADRYVALYGQVVGGCPTREA
jgi:glycosyltransferase involved in cell wall biosynthesis